MTFEEGLAIAEKYGLQEEFDYCYKAILSNAWYNGLDEDQVVMEALSEWDLL